MKCNQFEEGEIPYGALEKFGLYHASHLSGWKMAKSMSCSIRF